MKVKWWISTGFANAVHRGEWEVPDGTTDEELEEWLADEVANHIDGGFERAELEALG